MWLILDEAHITNVAVHPEYRKNNIGRTLMLEMMRRAALMGAVRMTLEVRPSNAAARRLYASLGFEVKGIRRRYYTDTNEDAIIMWKEDLTGCENRA
ncbi:acetyltransferases [Pelotomaculum thermopropionicum SI]|uniref:[Ribosomal protein bS18]-alanine N-acetyltransferase n=1 Tax=Pelotomaculum thermopropionicum (strain DSM 13744 / JCM 10971 / SI) TaxID=370438 RepID=A5D4C3_PELTS|nr:acetyltransferases [Pelotomaculum thermopropionicum SI]